MSEGRKNPSAALNDAALAGVSGGVAEKTHQMFALLAARLCRDCPARTENRPVCTGGEAALTEYYARNSGVVIHSWSECPFFKLPD